MEQSRRRMLASTAGLLTASTLAGCLDEDDQAGANGDEDGEVATASVTFLVEGVEGHDDEGHDDDHDDEGLSHDAIDHACGHMEYDDSDPIEAGDSPEDAPVVSETHQPFDITVEGESGYVAFEVTEDEDKHENEDEDEHEEGDTFGFFTHGGSVEIAEGHAGHAEQGIDDCNLIGAYVIVELDHGRAVAELSAE